MNDRPATARAVQAWSDVAASDLAAARLLAQTLPQIAAYHCQQAGEKLLKGFLVLGGRDVPRTHDLHSLIQLVGKTHPPVAELSDTLVELTVWGTAYRYPSEDVIEPAPDLADLEAAFAALDRVRDALMASLTDL